VRQTIQVEGVPVNVIDTAGLRDTVDTVEAIASRAPGRRSGMLTRCFWSSTHVPALPQPIGPSSTGCRKTEARYRVQQNRPLGDASRAEEDEQGWRIHVSAKTGDGIESLREVLLKLAGWQSGKRMCSWRVSGISFPRARRASSGPGRTGDVTERAFCGRTSLGAA